MNTVENQVLAISNKILEYNKKTLWLSDFIQDIQDYFNSKKIY